MLEVGKKYPRKKEGTGEVRIMRQIDPNPKPGVYAFQSSDGCLYTPEGHFWEADNPLSKNAEEPDDLIVENPAIPVRFAVIIDQHTQELISEAASSGRLTGSYGANGDSVQVFAPILTQNPDEAGKVCLDTADVDAALRTLKHYTGGFCTVVGAYAIGVISGGYEEPLREEAAAVGHPRVFLCVDDNAEPVVWVGTPNEVIRAERKSPTQWEVSL